MFLYKKFKRFNPNTGQPVDPILKPSGYLSDYTGEIIDLDDDEAKPLYTLGLEYNHDSEPLWYEDYHPLEEAFGLGYGDFSLFMKSPYHFANTDGYGCTDETLAIVKLWLKDLNAKKTRKDAQFWNCGTIEQVFSKVRVKTLTRLLKNKLYTLEDLGFITVDDL
jgi:hypothetical protein